MYKQTNQPENDAAESKIQGLPSHHRKIPATNKQGFFAGQHVTPLPSAINPPKSNLTPIVEEDELSDESAETDTPKSTDVARDNSDESIVAKSVTLPRFSFPFHEGFRRKRSDDDISPITAWKNSEDEAEAKADAEAEKNISVENPASVAAPADEISDSDDEENANKNKEDFMFGLEIGTKKFGSF